MYSYFIDTIILSFFISSIALGLRVISGEGMILYPLRKFCLSFGRKKQIKISREITELKKKARHMESNMTSYEIEEYDQVLKEIDDLKWKSFLIDAWHKPLLTCAACMSSVYGLITSGYFIYIYDIKLLYTCVFSIFLSVLINSIIWKSFNL